MAYAGGYPPKKGAEFLLITPIFDNDGDLVTGAAGLAAFISKDGGTAAATTNAPSEILDGSSAGTGKYSLTLTAAEMNADVVSVVITTTTTDAKSTPTTLYPSTDTLADVASAVSTINTAVSSLATAVSAIDTIVDTINTVLTNVSTVVQTTTVYRDTDLSISTTVDLSEMLDELGMMLNELNQAGGQPFEYSFGMGVKLLNNAVTKFLTLMPAAYFSDLHCVDMSVALDTNGAFSIASGLTHTAFRRENGIMGVRLNSNKFARQISFSEYIELEEANTTFSSEAPVRYVRGGYVYVEPYNTGDTVDVYYMREPIPMSLSADGVRASDVGCELPDETFPVLMDLAAWRGYRIGGDGARSEISYASALVAIEELKGRMKETESIAQAFLRELGSPPFGAGSVFNIYKGM